MVPFQIMDYRQRLGTSEDDLKDRPITKRTDLPKEEQKEIIEDIRDWRQYMQFLLYREVAKPIMSAPPCPHIRMFNEFVKASDAFQYNTLVGKGIQSCMEEDASMEEDSIMYEPPGMYISTQELNTDEAETERETGNRCMKDAQYSSAVEHYTRSLDLKPDKRTYNNRALAYIKLEKYADAFKDVNRVLSIDPCDTKGLYRRASCYKEFGQLEEAEKDLLEAARLDPEDRNIMILLAEVRNLSRNPQLKQYKIRDVEGNEYLTIPVNELKQYCTLNKRYVIEKDMNGCRNECRCGYCLEADKAFRSNSGGIFFRAEAKRWELLTPEVIARLSKY